MSKPDGGPAFPREDYQGDDAPGQRGASLRDCFAAAALPALIRCHFQDGTNKARGSGFAAAQEAYAFADAMLAERDKP